MLHALYFMAAPVSHMCVTFKMDRTVKGSESSDIWDMESGFDNTKIAWILKISYHTRISKHRTIKLIEGTKKKREVEYVR